MWILAAIIVVILLFALYKPANEWLMSLFKGKESYGLNYTQLPHHVMKKHLNNDRHSPDAMLKTVEKKEKRGILPPGYMGPYLGRMKAKSDFADVIKKNRSRIPMGYTPKIKGTPRGMETYANPLGKKFLSIRGDVGNVVSDSLNFGKPLTILSDDTR